KMLQPGEMIDADVVGDHRVVFAVGVRVNESRHAAPIFIRRVGEENPGHGFVGGGAIEQAATFPGDWIFLRLIGEGEDVGGKENGRVGLRVARRLSETVVEAAAASSGHVGENAVERDASVFVGIEPLIEKVPQKAAVLRYAFAIDALRWSQRVGSVLGVGSKIANGRESAAGHDGVGNNVNIFVDLAGLKAAVQMDKAVAGHEFAVDSMGKLHWARGMTVRGAPRESRTVSVLRGSSGAETGYSVPPMKPMMRCPNGISGITVEGIRSPRSSPVMVFPFSFATGAKKRSAPGPAASHCHPRLTTVKPLRRSQASPASLARS